MMSKPLSDPDKDADDKLDPETELFHVKWQEAKPLEPDQSKVNAIISSWQNPVFRFEPEPCHNTATNSRSLSFRFSFSILNEF
jgi:hypothetical protein